MLSVYYSSQKFAKREVSPRYFQISFFNPSHKSWFIRFGRTVGRTPITKLKIPIWKRLIEFISSYLVKHSQGTYLLWFVSMEQCWRIL